MQTPLQIFISDLLNGKIVDTIAAKEKYLEMEKDILLEFYQTGFVQCGRFISSVTNKTQDTSLKAEEYYNQKFKQ